MHTDKLGLKGEKLAARLLKKKGMTILERNFVCNFGEADIIATFGNQLVFCEVKSRQNDAFARPSQAVDYSKQKRYSDIARYYVMKKGLYDKCVRFDVVEYCGGALNHIENAFCGK